MATLKSIYIANEAGAPLRLVDRADLVAGRGIVGDRYYDRRGTFSKPEAIPDREVTLIESEQVERFIGGGASSLGPADFRRNLVTQGIDLNALVDREFTIGSIVLRGIRLCEPCQYLADLTRADLIVPMRHRAGLRAAIVRGGSLVVGDPIRSS